jgi:hypothetical protein
MILRVPGIAHVHNVTTERSQWTALRRPFEGPVPA